MMIRELMSPRAETVTTQENVRRAARTMQAADIGCLPVLDDGELVGVVTDRDLATRVLGEDRDPATTSVGDVMTKGCTVLRSDADVDDLAELMSKEQLHRVVILDEHDDPVGVVSTGDLARRNPERAAEALAEITTD